MSFLETMFLFFMGLFGIVQTSADVQSPYYPSQAYSFRVAQEAPPGGGGTFSPPPSGGTFSPPPGDSGGGGGFQPPPSGGSFGGDHQAPPGGFGAPPGGGGPLGPQPGGDQGFGGQPGGQFGGQPGGQFGGDQKGFGGQQGGNFGPGQGGQFGGPGQGGQGQFGGQQGGQFGDQKGFGGQQGQFGEPIRDDQRQFGGPGQGGQGQFGGQQGKFGGEQGFGGQGGERGFGPDGQQGQFGGEMNEEEQAKRQAQQDKQCVDGMKRGIKQMESGGPLKEISRLIARIKQQKGTPPEAAVQTAETIKAAIAKIKAATTCEEAQTAQEELQEAQGSLEEIMPALHMAAEAPRIKREILQGFKQIDRQWKTALARAKSSKVDLSELIARGQAMYDEIKGMFDRMIAALTAGDIEVMEGMMEEGDGAREKADELMEIAGTIDALRNVPRFIQQLNRGVNDLKRVAKDLARKKVDVSELSACLEGLKPVIANVTAESKKRPLDTENIIDLFEGSQDAIDQCEEIANNLRGIEDEGIFDDFLGDKLTKTFDDDRERRQKAQPTCRVNGVEVPGTCAEVEGRGAAAPTAPAAPAPVPTTEIPVQ